MKTNLTDIGPLVIRVLFSTSMIIIHGWNKFIMLLSGEGDFPDPLGVGSSMTLILLVIAELICPILIIIGFRTRYASIPVVTAMLVALLLFHAGDSFEDRELAYVYTVAFTSIFFLGSDKYSLDQLIERKSQQSNQ